MKGLVLYSGGLDSTVVLYDALSKGYDITALTFKYGQRHEHEVECAKKIANSLNIPQIIHHINLDSLINTPLLNKEAPKEGTMYVPARNTIFLSLALSVCEEKRIPNIFTGVNADDFNDYPDCRPSYIEAFEKLANLGSYGDYVVRAPLQGLSKKQIVSKALDLNIPIEATSSCYAPLNGVSCNECNACLLRNRALKCIQ